MAILGGTQSLERLKFFDGQRLFADDLDMLERFHREMRWLHNQSLHQPGIGRGLAVTGVKGAKVVTVEEGYAIDKDGREIVLTIPREVPVPPVAGDNGNPIAYDLMIAYPSDAALEIAETREDACRLSVGAVRLREDPTLCWVRLGADGQPIDGGLKSRAASGDLIRLARAHVLECKLFRDVSIAERRNARPPQQPYIASGRVVPAWTLAETPALDGIHLHLLGPILGARISTEAAGFRTTPSYMVQILGSRLYAGGEGSGLESVVFEGVPNVVEPAPDGFLLKVDLLAQLLQGQGSAISVEPFAEWEVMWIGIEG